MGCPGVRGESLVAAAAARLRKLRAGFREEEIRQAEAALKQAAANLALVRAGPRAQQIAEAEALQDAANAVLHRAEQHYQRVLELHASEGVSASEVEAATQERDVAKSQLVVRTCELELLREGARPEELERAESVWEEALANRDLVVRGARDEEIAEAEAMLAQAQAGLATIRERIDELVVRAPCAGIVDSLDLQPGDLVAPGAPVVTILDTGRLSVRAYVPEDVPLQLGQRVEISLNPYPGRRFPGEITYISRRTEFTPSNVQTPEDRAKQVFRIKVTLSPGDTPLRAGMIADVWLAPEESNK